MTDLALALATALARADNQPQASCAALCALAQELVGARLFTLSVIDAPAGLARRLYSNMPLAYPVSGTKPMQDDDWSRQVIGAQKIFVANRIEDIALVFPDHPLILSLGCAAVINVPVVVAGRVVGTVNCLDVAGHYTPTRVAAAAALRLPAAACLMLNMLLNKENL